MRIIASLIAFFLWSCSALYAQVQRQEELESKEEKSTIEVTVSVYNQIRANLDDNMNTIQGIIVDMDNREIHEGSMITNQAKISVFADPEASYNILVEDQQVVENPLNIFVTDGQTSRTIAKHGVDSFVMDGSFDSIDAVCTDSPKVVTIIYDAR